MKRPLLAVCIFLVCVCAGLNYGKSPGEETGKLVAGFLAGEEMTGPYQKKQTNISLYILFLFKTIYRNIKTFFIYPTK